MSDKRKVHVSINVDFFNNILEKERMMTEKQLGIKFSMPKFTEFLSKSNARITYPKIKKGGLRWKIDI